MTDSLPSRCVIVGASHAAAQCALSLRKDGWAGDITLVGEEPTPPYHRPPLSKAYIKGEVTLDSMLIRPLALYEQNKITLKLGLRVETIDRSQQQVRLSDGAHLPYDRLVLATGSVNSHPPIPGLDLPGVFFLRTAAEAQALAAAAEKATRLVVVGGGYIGLELAASFRSLGKSVTLLHHGPRILARVTSPEVSAFFEAVHREEGVALHTSVNVVSIRRGAGGLQVVTREDSTYDADLVIMGTGAQPNTALAKAAGLTLEHGIAVDEQTRTSDPHIFAIGDCAQQHHPLYEHSVYVASVQNAVDQAKTAAAALNNKPIPRRPLPWFWSDQYNIKLQIAGLSSGYTSVVRRGTPDARRSFSAWYFKGPQLIAVDTINDATAYVVGSKLIDGKVPVDPAQVSDPAHDLKSLLPKTRGA